MLLSCSTGLTFAQSDSINVKRPFTEGNNLIKLNVTGLFAKNISFEYERAVGQRISVGAAVRFMPKSGLPFKGLLEKLVDDDEVWNRITDARMSNFAFTPEVKFYLGKEVFKGFYVAPFLRYATYNGDLPNYRFDVNVTVAGQTYTEQKYVNLDGHLKTFTGGVLIGAQWKLTKMLYLDWWILGPQYGTNSGEFSGKVALNTQQEQDALREALSELNDLPIVKTEVIVDNNGGRLKTSGGWTGVRAGLNLGVRF